RVPLDLYVFADRNMLKTILRNLISNAIKFTPKSGQVRILAGIKHSYIEIVVSDTGIGMNKTMVDKLFRLDEHTSRLGTESEPSTGLGLIICKDFIEKHSGKLWVDSTEGVGTTFYFTLPH
ncbi:MAG: ATP-binding protein, partial [Bacteroidota bacterium]